jgi:molecular chaperone DnaK (HSP70)
MPSSTEPVSLVESARDRLPIDTLVLDKERRERVVVLIPADVELPFVYRSNFGYAYENMTAVRLELTVGPGETREQVHVIGKVELMDLPPRPRGTPMEVVLDHRGHELIARLTDVETRATEEKTIPMPQ